MGLIQELSNQPAPLSYWLNWMGLMNLLVPVFFLRRFEARIIIAAFLLNAAFMALLYEQMGYGKHLGLAHVVFWTPLVLWLTARFDTIRAAAGVYPVYIAALVVTNTISLAIDYIDVIKAFAIFAN